MAGDESARARRELRALEDRVEALETLAVRAMVLATTTLLIVGSLLPVYDGLERDAVPTLRLGTAAFVTFSRLDKVEDANGFAVTMGIGFLILLAGIIVAVSVGYHQWFRLGSRAVTRVAKAAVAVLWIGAAVALILTANVTGDDQPGESGPALWLFIPGALLFTLTTYRSGLRRLWNRED